MLRTTVLIVMTALVTVFFVQNMATTEVSFLIWSISAPRALILGLFLVIGWVMGYLVRALRLRRNTSAQSL
jgi:uncharacterized integral membrane protein